MYQARYFFDAGSGAILWPSSSEDWRRWGNPVDLARLPIGDGLRGELIHLIDWYDTSINWEYPPDPGPWREGECAEFNLAARQALHRLRTELGDDWQIIDLFTEVHEDQDLDRYLNDPDSFRR